MSDIKAGDLVMVVKPAPCCGDSRAIGCIRVVLGIERSAWECSECGGATVETCAVLGDEVGCELSRLKKIDPPADGDSLPTRKDLEVVA